MTANLDINFFTGRNSLFFFSIVSFSMVFIFQQSCCLLCIMYLQIRDTSVLVRLRPAWEDLRSYLTAKGRKRFEVYVCTMAERDYALEMWRLLDPGSHLINSKQLVDRVVCVKSGNNFYNAPFAMILNVQYRNYCDSSWLCILSIPVVALHPLFEY